MFNWRNRRILQFTKKVVRGDLELSEIKSNMGEELADCFIYLMKIANQFDVDIESEFIKK